MNRLPNSARGEASVAGIMLRPSFAALVSAEDELGPLFALVERAAAGQLKLHEMVALFWHCRFEAPADLTRDVFSDAVADNGLAAATPALKTLLGQILGGR